MNRKLLNALLLVLVLFGAACKKDKGEDPKEWVRGSDFDGDKRSAAVCFVIDGKAYITTGNDGNSTGLGPNLNALWYYDDTQSNWFKVLEAPFPGKGRYYAVAFAVNGKGYVGGGYDGTTIFNDFYEYDPATKKWKPIADFPGEARYGAVAFSGNGKGFVGSGKDQSKEMKDFFSYNPQTNQWSVEQSLPGIKRANAFTFTIGDDAYVGGGINNAAIQTDFWKFNTKTGAWTRLNDLLRTKKDSKYDYNVSRQLASAFVLGNKGYVVAGNAGGPLGTTFSYDPNIDAWDDHQSIGGNARQSAIAFSIGNRGFLTTGQNGTSDRFDDTWVFQPNK